MCGRYTVFTQDEDSMMNKYLSQAGFDDNIGDICPGGDAPIIITSQNKIFSRKGTWGFTGMSSLVINARLETATQKRYFSEAFAHRRCVIPATSFYEWYHKGGEEGRSIVYRFFTPGEEIFYMAGFYNYDNGTRRYVVLTMPASEDIEDIHTRMPVIIPQDKVRKYLTDPYKYYDIAIRSYPSLCRTGVGEEYEYEEQ